MMQTLAQRRSLRRAELRAERALVAKRKAPHGYRLNAAQRLKDAVTKALAVAARHGFVSHET